jgi:hypothetical protein
MLAYADQTGEALAGELRPGNAGAGTAADQIAVADAAVQQIPVEHIEDIEILLACWASTPPAPATNCWTGVATRRSLLRRL